MLKLIKNFFCDTFAIALFETIKIIRVPSEILARSAQPVLWLLIFGEVFTRIHMDVLGKQSYLAFIAPGILAQSVLFIAIFYGISVIWERDLGILHKILVTPCFRSALVLGKSISAGVRALSQLVIVLVLSFLLHLNLRWSLSMLAGVILIVMLEAAIFTAFSTAIACIVKTRERFMGVGQVLVMPLFFASNAIYPIAIMPRWLQIIAHWNPLSYAVDALRSLMLVDTESMFGYTTDCLVLLATLLVLIVASTLLYPRVIQ
ncbi:MAG: ABC transporter permease [Gammaproteobacteria bacterium]|nr:ABC transporter permease [Gammaproteobacteria bacterium]